MSKMTIGGVTIYLSDSQRNGPYTPQKFGEVESICGERCPYPDKPRCGPSGCSFYKEEVKRIKEKRNTVS